MIEVLRGHLGELPLPALLARLYREQRTGVLQVSVLGTGLGAETHQAHADTASSESGAHGLVAQVYLRGGQPAEVLLRSGADPLGTVLLETGALDRDRYLRAQALRPVGQLRFGELLIHGRLLDRPALMEGLRAQTRRRLHGLFFLPDASFQVFSGRHERGLQGKEPLVCDPFRILYFGLRRSWPDPRLEEEMRPLRGQELRLDQAQADLPLGRRASWLPRAEERACELLGRGAWELGELGVASGLSDPALHALLYALWLCGRLDVRPQMVNRPRRVLHEVERSAELPYQPADEPPPAGATSVAPSMGSAQPLIEGRPIRLQARSSQSTPAHAPAPPRRRLVTLSPIVATEVTLEPLLRVAPPPHPPPPPPAVVEPPPELAPERPAAPTRVAPPLRTSLPTGRLPSK